ncbi:MAG: hypothetical protein CVU55_14730 [Deltaproteobacteria bacterium HGW-Deltaproteobacteria-13]|jgi:hypothetical protein|nr:MAG: hypothetical protein CVU55_14730 [Deltaproteobacteria bacterium HGW-Deltaproteobacteria-13]
MKKVSNDLWREMFFLGSLWNIGIGLIGLCFYDLAITMLFGAHAVTDNLLALIFFRFFMIAVILFGVGYYVVSRNLSANRAVIWLGLTAKLIIFFTFVYYYALGQATWFSVFGCSGDFVFSILFILFLYQTKGGVYQTF